jgi:tripartite-type tricarboxylate transporter receptor subunit TctC
MVAALVAVMLGFTIRTASAQGPSAVSFAGEPIHLVVPYPPGGVNDIVARILATDVATRLGTPVIVDNKPGGGTIIGTQFVVNTKPDGHTWLMINPSGAINVSTQKSLPYDFARDLIPVSTVATYPTLLVASNALPAKSLQELIALAKAQPGKLNFASGGYGGSTHLAGELFKKMTGTDFVHVPFKGSASTIQALVSGEVAISFGDFATYLPLIQAGKLRAIAVASKERFPAAPDVPTMAEAGLPGFVIDVWLGIAVPKRTPERVVSAVNAAIRASLAESSVRDALTRQGVRPAGSTPDAFRATVDAEIAQWAAVVHDAGITPE